MKNYKKFISAGLSVLLLLFAVCSYTDANAASVKNTKDYTKTLEYKSYKDISIRYITINKMKKKADSLSEIDKAIIKKYVFGAVKGENTFLLINSSLRGNLSDYIAAGEITNPLKSRLNYYAQSLSSSIAKVTLPQNTTLYASMDDKGFKHIFKDYKTDSFAQKNASEETAESLSQKITGATFTGKGFLSASYDKDCIAKTKFRFEVKAPKNIQAVLIEEYGDKSKKRVIVNRGYKWKVMAVNCKYDKEAKSNYYNVIIKNIK